MICLLHVAICDDEETFVQHLNALLTRYAQETGIALKISTYRDGADLVDPYDASLDLIFLDIQMCAMDGLRAAEQIRKLDSKVAIIFLTTLTQYGLEGYQYQATNYIIKPLQYHRLKAEMDKFLAVGKQNQTRFCSSSMTQGNIRYFCGTCATSRPLTGTCSAIQNRKISYLTKV